MPSELVTDLTDADVNSAVDLDEFAAYLDDRSDVEDITPDETKDTRALLDAMKKLNGLSLMLKGSLQSSQQKNCWPRVESRSQYRRHRTLQLTGGIGVTDHSGRFWSASEWPQPFKDAQCEWAIVIRREGMKSAAASVGGFKLGDLTIDAPAGESIKQVAIPDTVLALLAPFLVGARLLKS